MSQFWAYHNPNSRTCAEYPFLLEVQSDLLSDLRTTVVMPLTAMQNAATSRMAKLNPLFIIDGKHYIGLVQEIAGLERKHLGEPAVDLTDYHADIVAALDFLISGI
ncbi:plasmid maintenance protein CcdB [Pseudidiomarina atlantica]|uniref:Toxin CcdB n=1 Tax=Pseudidiomarina atlantica TaxID=1517416 RepID=A0A094ILU9_9GAMM|nr:CcdB family protein [Pseudidiomarina atlantica]KFZ28147.1 plasmid maintenance protein CcdB [Pseudidiomarina atlantica]